MISDEQAADEPEQPLHIKVAMQAAAGRSWKELAQERLKDNRPLAHRQAFLDADRGRRHLSPHLGERMMATELLGKPVFLRELMPQDLKLEIARLSPIEATEVSRYLAGVVGKARARQMDVQTSKRWVSDLRKSRSKNLDAPSWLWNSIVDLVANHEAGYLEHCRRYCLDPAMARS